MFLAVWILYAADRLLDGMAGTVQDLEARHRFHRCHSRRFGMALVAASFCLVPLVLAMPTGLLKLYIELAVLLAAWLFAVHMLARSHFFTPPKELMPSLFFAAAVFLPVWEKTGFNRPGPALAATCYALLVMLNCLFIYAWEHIELASAHWTTRLGVRSLKELGLATILLSLLAIPFASEPIAPVFIAVGLAAALLLGLNQFRGAMRPTNLRAASDLVLLTPLVIAPFLRWPFLQWPFLQ